MGDTLYNRIDALESEIADLDDAAERQEIATRLDRVVTTLGRPLAASRPRVRRRTDLRVEEALEAHFDNMPV
ncbi:hypothetical protein [Litorisediminicola beolgyonensis]|uniref:Uncharacterized protein n=1 Tax=Litorisediminicola beolgyonensis TaxID=1173614 RepID=A0ABW3ZIJ2_9RHOB